MTDPIEKLKQNKPEISVDPLLLNEARETLMSEIKRDTNTFANETKNSEARTGVDGMRRHPVLLYSGLLAAFTLVGVGAFFIYNAKTDSDSFVESADSVASAVDPAERTEKPGQKNIVLKQPHASLKASSLVIDIDDDKQYEMPVKDDSFILKGDPGDDEKQALETQWVATNSAGEKVPMRLYVYFAADGENWHVTNVAAYNGEAEAEWIESHPNVNGNLFETALGETYSGDVELPLDGQGNSGEAITGTLKIQDMDLSAFTPPSECVSPTKQIALVSKDGDTIVMSVGSGGYGARVSFVDTETCKPLPPTRLQLEISSESEKISVTEEGISDGMLHYRLNAVEPTTETVTITATDSESGEQVDSIEIDVDVRDYSNL